MASLSLLLSVLLAATQAPTEDSVRWRCGDSIEREQGRVLVIRSLDARGRVLYDEVTWLQHTPLGSSSVSWERVDPTESAPPPWTLRTDFVSALLHLTRLSQRPVWLVLRIDGRVAGRRLLFRQMSELSDYEREERLLWADFSGHPRDAGRPPDVLPDLIDATEVVVTAEEEGGETLASYSIALPGRALIEEAVARAASAFDAAAANYRTECFEAGGQQ